MGKIAIFDLDGTVFDSMTNWLELDKKITSMFNIPFTSELLRKINTLSFYDSAVYLIEEYNLDVDPHYLANLWDNDAINMYKTDIELKNGIMEFLEYLKNNDYTIVGATSSERKFFNYALKRFSLEPYFLNIYTASEVGIAKNKPDFYRYILKSLKANDSDIIFFDDDYKALEAARSIGIKTYGVIDNTNLEVRRQLENNSICLISNFLDWKNWLE